jgi:hypothetical protein
MKQVTRQLKNMEEQAVQRKVANSYSYNPSSQGKGKLKPQPQGKTSNMVKQTTILPTE